MGDPDGIEIYFSWRDWAVPIRFGVWSWNGNIKIVVQVFCVTLSVIPAFIGEPQ